MATIDNGFEVGNRVMVTIEEADEYAMRAAEALDGRTGVVEAVEETPWPGQPRRRLVRFDEPAPTWFTHQTPATAFWFPIRDMTAMSSPS
jgi:hypothetical protein